MTRSIYSYLSQRAAGGISRCCWRKRELELQVRSEQLVTWATTNKAGEMKVTYLSSLLSIQCLDFCTAEALWPSPTSDRENNEEFDFQALG